MSEPGVVTDVAVFAVPFGLVGGRLYHVLTDWETYFGPGGNPVDALRIWHGVVPWSCRKRRR